MSLPDPSPPAAVITHGNLFTGHPESRDSPCAALPPIFRPNIVSAPLTFALSSHRLRCIHRARINPLCVRREWYAFRRDKNHVHRCARRVRKRVVYFSERERMSLVYFPKSFEYRTTYSAYEILRVIMYIVFYIIINRQSFCIIVVAIFSSR